MKRALAHDRPPQYERPAKGSAVVAVEVQIRELLRETPTMPTTVIAERIGWQRGMTILAEPEVSHRPDLSTAIFRFRPADGSRAAGEQADEASRRLLERINCHRRIVLSSTMVDGRYTLCICVVSHRTHHDRIAEALKIITAEAKRHATA